MRGQYICTSQHLIHSGTVPPDICLHCPYADKPNPSQGFGDTVEKITKATGLKKLAEAVSSILGKDCGCSKRKSKFNTWFSYESGANINGNWAVGVTTAPRAAHQWYLPECLAGIVGNRWSPWIFAEPESKLDGCENFDITRNPKKLGVWHNWLNMCRTLLESTDAEYILTMQDDTVLVPHARRVLDSITWPENCGALLPYTSAKYVRFSNGRPMYRIRTQSLWGACAIAFKRETLQQIVDHPLAQKWRGAPLRSRRKIKREPHQVANSDTAISKIMLKIHKDFYAFNPSLAQHIGDMSAIRGPNPATGNRRAQRVSESLDDFKELFQST